MVSRIGDDPKLQMTCDRCGKRRDEQLEVSPKAPWGLITWGEQGRDLCPSCCHYVWTIINIRKV